MPKRSADVTIVGPSGERTEAKVDLPDDPAEARSDGGMGAAAAARDTRVVDTADRTPETSRAPMDDADVGRARTDTAAVDRAARGGDSRVDPLPPAAFDRSMRTPVPREAIDTDGPAPRGRTIGDVRRTPGLRFSEGWVVSRDVRVNEAREAAGLEPVDIDPVEFDIRETGGADAPFVPTDADLGDIESALDE